MSPYQCIEEIILFGIMLFDSGELFSMQLISCICYELIDRNLKVLFIYGAKQWNYSLDRSFCHI